MRPEIFKYFLFAFIVIAALVSDQATKLWADARLATSTTHPRMIDGPHSFELQPDASAKGQKLVDYLKVDFTGTPEKEVESIARSWVTVDGKRVGSDYQLQGGETLLVQRRTIEVHPDYFHFRYTRNPGAAFSFLAGAGKSFRQPFFIIVSLAALVAIMLMYRKLESDQKLMMVSLSMIVGGALGNLIDRIAYGWVIDFIDWHYYREYTWPTFNIADVFITVGVSLMAFNLVLDTFRANKEDKEESAQPVAE